MAEVGLLRVRASGERAWVSTVDLAALEPGARLVALRAVLLGGAAASIGILSHLAGDGLLPHWPTLLILVTAAVGIASVLVLTRATRTRILLALVGGQALMHLTLSSLSGHRGQATEATGWWAHQLDHVAAQGLPMLAAHTGGALLLGLFLACAEESLWHGLVRGVLRRHLSRRHHQRLLVDALCGLLAGVRVPMSARGAQPTDFARTPIRARPTIVHRGPPVLLAA